MKSFVQSIVPGIVAAIAVVHSASADEPWKYVRGAEAETDEELVDEIAQVALFQPAAQPPPPAPAPTTIPICSATCPARRPSFSTATPTAGAR
jgi:hypothetical protein